ncbi:hypothetical protein LSH36_583g01046 [Paralvinella palmiformis]|uniref:Large ribosomal subunit protein bL28c n=1 Tax=Paralvinella palmiformis TaxID=53620 RepID=A0AAD9J545_9ANNE|nr:hypothetical protein LSH36_583g01046 [Paralvinella palmiformis]
MRQCVLTGKRASFGKNVSHAHNKTSKKQSTNIQKKRIYIPEKNKFVRIKVSAHAIRTIEKIGLLLFLKKKGLRLQDIT